MSASNNGSSHEGDDRSTVVMGAGPGGLCSAYVLSKAGVPTTVVERAPFVGGLARTIRRETEYGEFKFDIGGHRWFTKNDELNDLFKEVVDDELLWVDRVSRIYFDGRYVDYPLKISNALKAIGPVTSAKAMADYGKTRVEQKISPKPVVSMEDAYIDQFGTTLYKLFFERYSEKVWGLPCSQMSGDWVTQRSKGMSLVTAVKDAIVPSKGKVVSLIDNFMYPRDGFGRFSERMADSITSMGNTIELETGVETVHREGNKVVAITVATPEGPRRIEAANFISSIPLTVLAKIIDPVAPPDVIEAANSLTFRNVITVNLMLKKPQVTNDTWLYVHDRNILFGRFHEPKNWSAAMVPGPEYTSLVIEYFCSFGDDIWNMTEEQLVDQSVRHLVEDMKFIKPDEVIGGFAIRAPRAYPSYVIGYEKHLEKVKDFVFSLENLQIIGRYGTFRYNNTDHSIETGLLAAKNLLGEHHDLDDVNADKEYHEIKRVERDLVGEQILGSPLSPPIEEHALDAVAAHSDPAQTGPAGSRSRVGIGRWWRSRETAQRYLVILLLLFVVKQTFNVIVFPPFSGHDEVAHYAYLRTVATEHRVPVIPDLEEWRRAWTARGDLPGDTLPKDLYRYCRFVLGWDYCEEEQWKNNPPVAVTYSGQFYPHGWNYASNHPPLFYVLMTPFYLLTDNGTPAQQQYVLRAATIPIGMVIVLLTFLIAKLLFLRDSFIPIIAATFVAFQTQLSYESAMINNDILLVAFFTLALYVLIRGVRQGFTVSSAAVLGLVVGLGLLTKASMITILPIIAIVLILAVGYRRVRRWIMLGAVTGFVAGLVVWPWYLFLYRTYGNFSALPQVKDLQFLFTYRGKTPPTILQQLWDRDFAADRWSETWGDFGWRLIQLPNWLLTLIGLPILLVVIASLFGLIWASIELIRRKTLPAFLRIDVTQASGLWLMMLVCILAYGAMLQFGTTFSLTQARYYFNAVPAAAILIAFGLRTLTPGRARPGVAAGFLVFMIAINILIYSQGVLPFWYLPT